MCKSFKNFESNCASFRSEAIETVVSFIFVDFHAKYLILFSFPVVQLLKMFINVSVIVFFSRFGCMLLLGYFTLIHLCFVLIHVAIVAVKKKPRHVPNIAAHFICTFNLVPHKHIRNGSWHFAGTKELIVVLVRSHLLAQCGVLHDTHTKNRFSCTVKTTIT